MKINWLYFLAVILFFNITNAQPGGGFSGPRGGGMMEGYGVFALAFDSLSNKPIPYVTAELKSHPDNLLVDGQVSDSTGRLFFKVTKPGRYYLNITPLGYKAYVSEPFYLNDTAKFKRIGKIYLMPVIKTSGEIKIEASGPLIQNKVDKLVYDASQDITSAGGTATDVLRKAPMVEVDADGNVGMRGSKNIKILLNGKPSAMMNSSAKDALQMIPADQIDKVEIITNPSAKYDAEGTAGIINIITKQQTVKGKSGTIRFGVGNRSNMLGANLSIQNAKTSYSFGIGGMLWRTVGTGSTDRHNTYNNVDYELLQTSKNRTWGGGPRINLGIDHKFNKFNSMSFSLTGRGMLNSNKSDFTTETGPSSLPLSFLYNRNNYNFTTTLGYDANLDYHRTYKKPERELGLSFQYSGNTQTTDYDAKQYDQYKVKTYAEKSRNRGQNNEYTAQIDFTEPLSKKVLLETGAKTILRTVTSKYEFDSLVLASNEYKSITSRNNNFVYNQNVYGGYTQFTFKVNDKYSIKTGGRYEFTTFGGGYADSAEKFKGKPYGNFIPYVNINRTIGYGGFVRLQYTKRIQRPSLFYLNPYTNYSDPRNLTTGNPELTAEVSNNFEASYGKYGRGGGFSTSVYHRRIENAIETIRQVDSTGVYRTTYGNIGKNRTTGIDLNMNIQGKKFMVNFNGGLGYVSISTTSSNSLVSGLTKTGITYSAGVHFNYKFTKRFIVEGFSRINAPSFSLQGKSQNWYFHAIGFKRRFKNDRGGIGMGIDNPFTPTVTYTTYTEGKDFTYKDVRKVNMLGLKINFDYRFGKVDFQSETAKPSGGKKKGIKNDDLKEGENQGGGAASGS